ncbi:sporulation membrane protein YtaF [Clostridium chauvoei]|uniref:Sporulation membrane protein YtaF n=2 Tax=Clostridium chauvoei TaxID=46867 RepID=A0ABD4RH30_9CLOT|nr:sporulation membrane protein YtaF [Clostridium chauvoei]ATD55484.1 sporulation membrane protein YtaF [Clostridium chauvoei]ATD56842.1 sporulation membrane protein YtaF [Clostridium chauvoei]MBX7280699.1 sporulation membrane protein YtaF [Clostridium chauvoei]MBX7283182.1 sporulation membrane protein YtaF [Clostridium chauvoei]MBX7285740.1 sporulation membrane protein YtaF [Clostridium chauvoei]
MLETLLLVLSVSIDSFVASIAYGTDKIKIPFLSALIIDIICSSMLGISLLLGSLIKDYIPRNLAIGISFVILFGLGVYRLFESIFKTYIKSKSNSITPLTFKIFDFNFVLQVYADETKADFDKSKILTSKEAFYLAFALSLDSLAVGFGSSLITVSYIEAILLSLILGMTAILTGVYIGRKFIEKVDLNLSWLSGALLILLALMRVI